MISSSPAVVSHTIRVIENNHNVDPDKKNFSAVLSKSQNSVFIGVNGLLIKISFTPQTDMPSVSDEGCFDTLQVSNGNTFSDQSLQNICNTWTGRQPVNFLDKIRTVFL
jgi:hypothetical protein